MAVAIDVLEVNAMTYNKYSVNLGESKGFGGCALSSCDPSVQAWFYRNGGEPYYATFPQHSKKYYTGLFNSVDRKFIK
jgi:hypothetical protein